MHSPRLQLSGSSLCPNTPRAGVCARNSRAWLRLLAVLWLTAPLTARGDAYEAVPEGIDARDLVLRAESNLWSGRTFLRAKMTVRSSRILRARELHFHSFLDLPRRRSFVRIVEPSKEKGTSFLWLDPNLWTRSPGEERTALIPRSRLREPWMKSHFTLDDLLHGTRDVDDYEHQLIGIDPAPEGFAGQRAYVIESRPRSGAPELWPRRVTWVAADSGTPLRREYFDAEGKQVRVLQFGDFREVQGRQFPHLWTLRPAGSKKHESRVEVESVRFDADFEETVFTTQYLMSAE